MEISKGCGDFDKKAYNKGFKTGHSIKCSGSDYVHIDGWEPAGKEFALKGLSIEDDYENYAKECGRYKVKINKKDFRAGYQRGLQLFCTFSGGRRFGMKGERYRKNCPPELVEEFSKGLKSGQKILSSRSKKLDIESSNIQIRSLKNKLFTIESQKELKLKELDNTILALKSDIQSANSRKASKNFLSRLKSELQEEIGEKINVENSYNQKIRTLKNQLGTLETKIQSGLK